MTYKTATNSQRIPLKDITLMIKRGITPKYTDVKGIEVINQRCIRDSRINLELVRLNDTDKRKISEEKYLQKYDVLVNSTGVGTLGRVAQYLISEKTKRTVDSHVTIVRPIKNIDPIYFGYAIRNEEILIESLGEGSTGQTELSRHRLGEEIRINVPSSEEQKAIANILSSLDDKIEINNAIIANLEEQAQAIFKSWFINFEPFQDEEFVESEIGNIPRNWEVGLLGNSKLGELKSSGIEDFEGEKIYIATADVEGTWINSENTGVTYEDKPSRANMQPTPYSVWFAKMKDSRKLILVDNFDKYLLDNMIFSTGFAGIQCNKLSVYYLWEFIKSNYFDEVKNQYSTGTTMQAINNKNINQILVIIPPQIVLSKFNSILHPINNKISLLKRENITLAEARDTLLPKLMSGEIRVEEATEVN